MDKYNMRNHAIYDECSVSNGNYLYHVFSLPSPSRCSFSAFPLCDPSNGFAGNIRSSQFYQYLSSPCVFPNVPSTLYQPGQEKSRFASEQPLSLIPGPSCFIPPHPMPAIQPVVIQSPHCSNFDNTLQISEMFKVSKNNQFNDKGNLESIKEAEWAKVEQLVHMFHAADKTKSKPTTIYVEDLERIIFRELIDKESQKIKFGKLKIESLERTKVKVENLKENKIELETIHKENKVKTEIESPKHQETKVTKIKVENSEGGEIKIKDWMEETQKKEYKMSRNHKDKYDNSNQRRVYTLMCAEDYQSGKKSHWSELEITGSIRNLSSNLWQMTHLTALYLNDNSLQRVPCEIGRLVNLRILDLSSNKLRSLPAELGELIYLRELLLNQNYLRVLPYELGKLFQLQVLGLQGNPLSKDVMTLYGNGEPAGTNKLLTYMLDNLQVTANHPPQRPWIPLTRPNRSRPTCIFTVMCYNVLCDKYATRQMYGYCPSWALDWEYRKKGILDEIRHYAADIISLQEVETDQFYNFFLPELKHDGYDGIFSPKSRAKTMAENDRKYVDGCAIFYRTAKFSLIKEHLVEFNQLAMANAEGSDNMLNRVMPKDNIGLAALLRTKEAAWDNGVPSDPAQVQQPILVCTAHIHWDPEFCDVKLIQTMMLSNELRSILDQAGQSFRPGHKPDSSNVQLLLCGDFNSLPDSGVIEFLTSGRVAADHRDFKDLAYKSCLQKISVCDKPNEFTHSFKLASAYSEDIMPYTNYTFEFKGIIDYIFYSKQSMVPLGLLGPLSPEWFKEHKVVGCPHPHVPSDHFPLLVELEMTPTVGTSNGLISRR